VKAQASASWNPTELLAWLVRHPEALEPGVRIFDPLPESVRNLGAMAGGPDPLGRPALLLLPADDTPESVLEPLLALATRARADAGALTPWFARPREPRLFLVAPPLPADLRARLVLFGPGLGLRLWCVVWEGKAVDRPRLVCVLPERLQRPLGEAPAAPAGCQRYLRRLLSSVAQIRPEIEVHGTEWPLVFTGARGACAALHRDGEDLLFVTERAARRTEILRLADEESVDRALDALLREQFSAAQVA